MTLSRAHTSAKAADPTKLLLLNRRRIKHSVAWYRSAPPNRNHKLTLTLTLNVTWPSD